MAKINGTDLLVYADGTLIAYQKTCTVTWEQDLPDATTKDSGGWEEHLNGTRRATCDFDGLYSTTGLSAEDLITYITGRTSCVLLIDGGGYPIVGEARQKNLSVSAPKEEAAGISGSFTFDGAAWMLNAAFPNLITDPDGTYNDYDTLTVDGIAITSAINLAGDADVKSNTFDVTIGGRVQVVTFLTLNSGAAPTVRLLDDIPSVRSNNVIMTEGVNSITLTQTATATVNLNFHNVAAADWSLSKIYAFRV